MALVEAHHLTKSYARGAEKFYAADDVSFTIERGETLGLVGESGSGKSTIARLLLRLLAADSGTVRFDGHDVLGASTKQMRDLRRGMQIVFQDPYAALNPRMRVRDLLAEPLQIHGNNQSTSPSQQIETMLRAVGLDASAMPRFPHEFSGGQRQRINIARALMLRPQFLVLDEPVSALDVSVGAQIVNLLRDLQRDFGLTYLFITHSMPLVRYLATRIAVMRRGKLIEIGASEEICERPREDYTRTLLAATPEMPVVP
ncbi:MAG TPA: ABC transporter ATP-binding protein [Acidobacteriaceae bacterium]|nr:ABC transporter ATP-binding protein [Acidobacteriaceae bacterium]